VGPATPTVNPKKSGAKMARNGYFFDFPIGTLNNPLKIA